MSEKKKPRGKPFAPDDARRNTRGQRSAAAVSTAAQYRECLLDVLHLKAGTPAPPDASNLQMLAFTQVQNALHDRKEREDLWDRIWGKSPKTVKYEGTPPAAPTVIVLPANNRDE
jgi:hypothetical protein